MELIDRKALINQLKEENIPFNADINEIINIQPIAFDTEKVIAELEELHKKCENCPKFEKVFRQVAFEKSIDIVKKGGVE